MEAAYGCKMSYKIFHVYIFPVSKAVADQTKHMPCHFWRWKLHIQAALPGITIYAAQSFLYQTQLHNSSQSLKLKAL